MLMYCIFSQIDCTLLQDVTAGSCFQTNKLIEDGDFSGKMTSAEHQAFTQCGFNSMEGFELAENLECSVRFTPTCCVSMRRPHRY